MRRARSDRPRRPDVKAMEAGIRGFLRAADGPLRGELARTPARVARAWVDDLLAGYRDDPDRILAPLRSERGRDLVAVRGIDFVSTCAHHLLPFHGRVHLAYLPEGRITGISRLAKLVHCLSRRLQIQENLTREIVEAIDRALAPRGAACVIEATHLCMIARGRRVSSGVVVTAAGTGIFENEAGRGGPILSLLRAGGPSRRGGSARRARRPSRR